MVLVDLPPDDLRQRLKEGKVYIAGQAERAIEHFFRKGNLIALRELALRRTADRVDEQMRAWRGILAKRKCGTRATRSFYASAITPAAKNWSAQRRGWRHGWVASGTRCMLKPLPCTAYRKKRRAILSALRLAQELGAETATLSDPAEEKAVVRYAREHNLGKIILGRPASRRWWRRETFADRLARIAPISIRCWSRLMNHPPARLTTRRITALLKTSGVYKFRDAWLPPRYAPLSP